MKKKTTSEITASNPPQEISVATSTPFIPKQIGKLHVTGNEDMNKVVEKINELIDKLNGIN